MKLINIILIAGILTLFPFAHLNAEAIKKCRINMDLNNDGNIDKVVISPNAITLYGRNSRTTELRLSHKFVSNTSELSRFNQHDIIDRRLEMIFGQDISNPFNLKHNAGNARYNITRNISAKDKFIIADINKDGLLDFVKISYSAANNFGLYQHLVYYQAVNFSFPEKPGKIIEEKRSSWISGIYYDINKDGLPEKIEINYKRYGALLSNTKCIINIHSIDNMTRHYKNKPDMRIISNGIFYENNNFVDINNDGYPDVFIVDIPKIPRSLQETVSKILDRRMDIIIKFYLYNDGVKGYPQTPSFTQKINIDILQDFTISLGYDFNSDGYNDLSITQLNYSEKYLFDQQRRLFKKIRFK